MLQERGLSGRRLRNLRRLRRPIRHLMILFMADDFFLTLNRHYLSHSRRCVLQHP